MRNIEVDTRPCNEHDDLVLVIDVTNDYRWQQCGRVVQHGEPAELVHGCIKDMVYNPRLEELRQPIPVSDDEGAGLPAAIAQLGR